MFSIKKILLAMLINILLMFTFTTTAFVNVTNSDALALVPPAIPDQKLLARNKAKNFGLSAFVLDAETSTVKEKVAALVDLDVKIVRLDFQWAEREIAKGVWDLEATDYAVDLIAQNGIEIVAVLAFTPDWASSAPPNTESSEIHGYPPKEADDFKQSASFLAKRYGPKIKYWQIWTEPDNPFFWRPEPNPKAFAELAAKGYQGIKEGNPKASVVMAGITTGYKAKFFNEALSSGFAESYDIIASHDYSNLPEGHIFQEVIDLKNLSRRFKKKESELWLTETGWSTYKASITDGLNFIDPVSEEEQATLIAKRMLYLVDVPVENAFFWELNDFRDDPGLLLFNLGLMRNNLSKKPAYFVFKNINSLIGGETNKADIFFNTQSTDPKNLEFHSFINSDNKLVLSVWNSSNESSVVDINFVSDDYYNPKEFDIHSGNLTPALASVESDRISLLNIEINDQPRIFIFERPPLFSSYSKFSPNGDGNKDDVDIIFNLDTTESLTINIKDSNGFLVRTLWSQQTLPGSYAVNWDGRDEAGSLLPSNDYLVELNNSSGVVESNNIGLDIQAPIAKSLSTLPEELFIINESEIPYIALPTWFDSSEPVTARLEVYDQLGELVGWVDHDSELMDGNNMAPWYVNYFNYVEGTYWYKLTLTDAAGNQSTFLPGTDWQALHVDFTPPKINKIDFTTNPITPNGDGIDDFTDIIFDISENADVYILLKSDDIQYNLYAKENGAPGEHRVSWNGQVIDPTNGKLIDIPNGRHTIEIIAVDYAGMSSRATKEIIINDKTQGSISWAAEWDSDILKSWSYDASKIATGDFDGDGKDDVAIAYGYLTEGEVKVFVLKGNDSGGFDAPEIWWSSGPGNWDWAGLKLTSGDYDRDGKSDLVALYGYKTERDVRAFVFLSEGSKFLGPVSWFHAGPGNWDWSGSKLISGDFNGDGKSDLAILYGYETERDVRLFVFLSDGAKFINASSWFHAGANNWDWNGSKLSVGDFNGDGKDDINILYGYETNKDVISFVFLSTGGSFSSPSKWWQAGAGNWDWGGSKMVSDDFDGDGVDDMAIFYGYLGSRSMIYGFISSKSGFKALPSWYDSGVGNWNWNATKILSGDFDGDGISEIAGLYNYGSSVKLFQIR